MLSSSTVFSAAKNKQQNTQNTQNDNKNKQTNKTRKCKEDVTLESETAYTNLLVSENKKNLLLLWKKGKKLMLLISC